MNSTEGRCDMVSPMCPCPMASVLTAFRVASARRAAIVVEQAMHVLHPVEDHEGAQHRETRCACPMRWRQALRSESHWLDPSIQADCPRQNQEDTPRIFMNFLMEVDNCTLDDHVSHIKQVVSVCVWHIVEHV